MCIPTQPALHYVMAVEETTLCLGKEAAMTLSTSTHKNGFLRGMMSAFVARREREAERQVLRTLLMFDDSTLRGAGINRTELQRRVGATI